MLALTELESALRATGENRDREICFFPPTHTNDVEGLEAINLSRTIAVGQAGESQCERYLGVRDRVMTRAQTTRALERFCGFDLREV